MRRLGLMLVLGGLVPIPSAQALPARNAVATLTGSGIGGGDLNEQDTTRAVHLDLDMLLTRAPSEAPGLNPLYYQPSGRGTVTFEGFEPVDFHIFYGGWERTDPAWGIIAGLGTDGNAYWIGLYDGTGGHSDQLFVRRCTAPDFIQQPIALTCEFSISLSLSYAVEGDFVFEELL